MREKEKRGVRRSVFWTLFAGMIAACGIVAVILSYYNDPMKTAKAYLDAIMEREWDTVYEMLDVAGDGQFLARSNYVAVVEEQFRSMEDYTLTRQGHNTYVVDYHTKSGEEQTTIILREQPERELFVFKQYKVEPVDLIAEEIYFIVPQDITVLLNGILIEPEYLVENDRAEEAGITCEVHELVYCLPSMYIGKYLLELSGECYQDYTEEITIHKTGETIRPALPYLSEEVVAQVSENALAYAVEMSEALGNDDADAGQSTYIDVSLSDRQVWIDSYGYTSEGKLMVALTVESAWRATKATQMLDTETQMHYYSYEPQSEELSYELTYVYEDANWVLSESE